MKFIVRILIGILILIVTFGISWIIAKTRASPPASGEAYLLVQDWPKLPDGMKLGQVSGVDVDSSGDVYVFHRAERIWEGEDIELKTISSPTILVLDNETGELIDQWGADTFVMPHGLTIDDDNNIWLTDVGLHQVFKYDRDGTLLLALGERGVPGDDETHFNMPTDVAIAPDGSFYVSDGYRNSRVARFSPDGTFLGSWGTSGQERGQFDVPHSIALDPQGKLYIADRGNARLQIFDLEGNFREEWKSTVLGRPWAVRVDEDGNIFIVDGGDQNSFWPDRARVLKFSSDGTILASFGSYGTEPGQFIWPHTIAVGPDGAIYVGEVATGMRIQKFIRSIQE